MVLTSDHASDTELLTSEAVSFLSGECSAGEVTCSIDSLTELPPAQRLLSRSTSGTFADIGRLQTSKSACRGTARSRWPGCGTDGRDAGQGMAPLDGHTSNATVMLSKSMESAQPSSLEGLVVGWSD